MQGGIFDGLPFNFSDAKWDSNDHTWARGKTHSFTLNLIKEVF